MGKVSGLRKVPDKNLVEEVFLNDLIEQSLQPGDLDGVDFILAGVKGRKVDPDIFRLDGPPPRRRVLWHTSDEKMRHRGHMYEDFDAVMRNHFDPRMGWKKKVVTFPLGYLSGFVGEPYTNAGPRTYLWSFCGAGYKGQRKDMMEAFSDLPHGYMRLASGWFTHSGDLEPLSQQELASVYQDSEFVLCPQGINHPDTFRIMEALQSGAIPVMVRFLGHDYAKYTFGNHPFIVAKTWPEAADILRHFQENPDLLANKRKEVNEWYATYREELLHYFRRIVISDVPSPREWEVLKIQRRARWNLLFVFQVWRRFHPNYRKKLDVRTRP
jgi:hypothetical protein